jgi:dihydrofolate reductase
MARVVLHFSMSLDGFVAGPDVGIEQPMGVGGERLHKWMFNDNPDQSSDAAPSSVSKEDAELVQEVVASVGAVVLGRRTFDVGLRHWDDTPYPAPSFVLTHEARDQLAMKSAAFTFVTDGVESAVRQAMAVAGEKNITVMGANAAQQVLKAGLADEIQIQLIPVLLGVGARLFDHIGNEHIELKRTRVVASPLVTHLAFEVEKQAPKQG